MQTTRKYRPEFKITPLLPVALILILFMFASVFFSISAGLFIIAVAFLSYATFSALAWIRTRNIGYLAAFLFQLLIAIYNLTLPEGLFPFDDRSKAFFFYFCGIIVLIWLLYLMLSQKGKWKGRNIFELIALQLDEPVDGYTNRPRPAGRIEISKSELFGFAEFARKNLIAMPFSEENRMVFVPVKMGDEHPFIFGTVGDYRYYSWIAVDYEGNVSANLSKKDYLAYREAYSFDQLSDSLGKLFIEFMEYFQKNEPERIMHRIKSVKVGMMF